MKLKAISAIPCGFLLLTAACRQDMHDQPRYLPLQTSSFFADGRASRPIPEGTVARDDVITPGVLQTGDRNGDFSDVIPVKVDLALLKRGQERYDVYCVPCHGYLGDGDGMVSRRGVRVPANLHSDRIRQAPPGYIFQVITKGYGAMGDYADQISSDTDRWAIVAYVRALELSQNTTMDQVPDADRAKLEGAAQ